MRLAIFSRLDARMMMGMFFAVVLQFQNRWRELLTQDVDDSLRARGQRLRRAEGLRHFGITPCNAACVKHIKPIMQRKSTRHRAFDPDPEAPQTYCDMPGCTANAGYRAPRSRDTLRSYFWFCLEHVRQYNANWDFYKGMTPGQIENHLRADVSWQRPSWKLGTRGGQVFNEEEVLDPLDLLGAERRKRAERRRSRPQARSATPDVLRTPLSTLGLDWPVAMEELKARYKSLARQHHPDANGGDSAAEERFKAVVAAYTIVRVHLEQSADLDAVKAG